MNSKSLKIILGILLLMFIGVALGAFKYKSEINAKRFYKQGMSFYKKGNYSDAYYNFKQINKMSGLYIASLLKQYSCAYKLQDKKTAHLKLIEIIRNTQNNYILPYVLYNEAVLSEELNQDNPKQILKKFKKIINNYPDNDFYYASAYKVATLSDDKFFARDKYIEYLEYAPIGKFALSALENLGKQSDTLYEKDKEVVANSYYLNSKYEEALKYYKETNFSKSWYNLSKCYRQLGKREEEKNTIINGLNLKQSGVEQKDVDSAINRLITLSGGNRLQILQELYKKSSDSYIYPAVIYNLAEASQSLHAIKLYEQVVKNYPDSVWASNSLWEIFWYNYSLNRFKTCIKLGQMHREKYKDSSDAPRVAYWSARALLKEKETKKARELFYTIIKDYPLSYYAFLSSKQLKISKAKNIIVKKPVTIFNINSLNHHIFAKDSILLFFANNDDTEMLEELKINDEHIKSWLMFKKENYPNSINTAKNEYLKRLNDDEELCASYSDKELKLIYPILYDSEINEAAIKFNQSPYLFLSIIREESHFNKNAQSSAGAIGLVQLMPATADFIEKRPVSLQELKQNNIEIGLKYFNYLVDMFDGNEYLAILAYNGGPGNVKKWYSDVFIKHNDIDEFVENIPYLETKNYIKKVLSAYWIYFNIYK